MKNLNFKIGFTLFALNISSALKKFKYNALLRYFTYLKLSLCMLKKYKIIYTKQFRVKALTIKKSF